MRALPVQTLLLKWNCISLTKFSCKKYFLKTLLNFVTDYLMMTFVEHWKIRWKFSFRGILRLNFRVTYSSQYLWQLARTPPTQISGHEHGMTVTLALVMALNIDNAQRAPQEVILFDNKLFLRKYDALRQSLIKIL